MRGPPRLLESGGPPGGVLLPSGDPPGIPEGGEAKDRGHGAGRFLICQNGGFGAANGSGGPHHQSAATGSGRPVHEDHGLGLPGAYHPMGVARAHARALRERCGSYVKPHTGFQDALEGMT